MENKLPSVFVGREAKNIDPNNKSVFYSNSKFQTETILQKDDASKEFLNELSVKKKINDIFSSKKFAYKAKVLINTKSDGNLREIIIARMPEGLLTITNKIIKYQDVLDIKLI